MLTSSQQNQGRASEFTAQQSASRDHPDAVSLAEKIRFLSRPSSYSERPDRVEVIETHFSWVFLTATRAYKLKKPVQGSGLIFANRSAPPQRSGRATPEPQAGGFGLYRRAAAYPRSRWWPRNRWSGIPVIGW
jgi:hypothetical protein